jgi:molybdenum cofactor cytidylyltransferase
VQGVVLVVHPADQHLIEKYQSGRVHLVVPDEPPPDMKASVLHGLKYVAQHFSPEDQDAWLVSPADVPWLSPRVVDGLIELHGKRNDVIRVPTAGGRRGHPVLFPWTMATLAENLVTHQGLNALFQLGMVQETEFPYEDIHGDLNTPEDYQRAVHRYFPPDLA